MTALAENCQERDLLRAALELYDQSYKIDESTLGRYSLHTINSLLNKARIQHHLGHYTKARMSMEEALNLGKTVLDAQHLSYLIAQDLYALLLVDLGQVQEAKKLLTGVLESLLPQLGHKHTIALSAQMHMASIHQKLDNIDEAIAMHEQVLAARLDLHGETSLLTAASRTCLAHAYQAKGRSAEALDVAMSALNVRIKVLGSKHRVTLTSEHCIGLIYMKLDYDAEAKKHLSIAANGRFEIFGLVHIMTFDALHDLGLLYQKLRMSQEAHRLLNYVAISRCQLLGFQHPDTLSSQKVLKSLAVVEDPDGEPIYDNLDHSLVDEIMGPRKLNDFTMASPANAHVDMLERTRQEMTSVLGEISPLTLEVTRRLAIELANAGKCENARVHFDQVWQERYSKAVYHADKTAEFLLEYIKCLQGSGELNERISNTLKHALSIAVQAINIPLFKLLAEANANPDIADESGSTPLMYATLLDLKGKRMITELLKLGAKQIARNDGRTPLVVAFESSFDDVFALLLSKTTDIESILSDGEPLLFRACFSERLTIVNALLEADVDPVQSSSQGTQPLHAATYRNNVPIMKALIVSGVSPDVETVGTRFTPIHIASECNHCEALQYLLSIGAKATVFSAAGFAPIHTAVEKSSTNTMRMLLDAGVDVEQISQNGDRGRPIHFAAQYGDVETMENLLNRRVDVNLATSNGTTPLHLASQFGSAAVLSLLIDAAARANVVNEAGCTPIYCAALVGSVEKLSLLLKEGTADPHILKPSGYSLLHAAALNGHADAISYLLSTTALNPDIQTSAGHSALHFAAEGGHDKAVGALLTPVTTSDSTADRATNPVLQSGEGYTALHFAVVNAHLSTVQGLLDHTSHPLVEAESIANIGDKNGLTPLHYAVVTNAADIIDALVAGKANIEARMIGGLTPIMLGVWKRCVPGIQQLIANGAEIRVIDCFGMRLADYISCGYIDNLKVPHRMRQTKPLGERERREKMRESVKELAELLLKDLNNAPCSDAIDILGRCLLRLDEVDDALCAFQLIMTKPSGVSECPSSDATNQSMQDQASNDGQGIEYTTTCDLCSPEAAIKGDRWVCGSCPDYDLCGPCYESYIFGKADSEEGKLGGCMGKGHPWVKIEGLAWEWRQGSWKNAKDEDVESWLKRLAYRT